MTIGVFSLIWYGVGAILFALLARSSRKYIPYFVINIASSIICALLAIYNIIGML
jgi:hypothetical protein